MLRTHYTLMNSQEEAVKRPLPIPFVAYNICMGLLHEGITIEAALKLDDEHFGSLFSRCLQVTKDVGLLPYQRDITPGFAVSMMGGLTLYPMDTENMVTRACVPSAASC